MNAALLCLLFSWVEQPAATTNPAVPLAGTVWQVQSKDGGAKITWAFDKGGKVRFVFGDGIAQEGRWSQRGRVVRVYYDVPAGAICYVCVMVNDTTMHGRTLPGVVESQGGFTLVRATR